MSSVAEMISKARQGLRVVNLDEWIPARYIHKVLIDKARLFIKRENDDRNCQNYPDIWVTVQNFDLCEGSLIECLGMNIPSCKTVRKSKLKLPDIYTTRYGYLVNISSIDFSGNYVQVTPRRYSQIKSRRYQNPKERYYWITNGYLIIPDTFLDKVTIRAMFTNKAEGLRLSGCDTPSCVKVLDQQFVAPGHLLDDILKAAVVDIAEIRQRQQPDTNTDLNELQKIGPK